MIELDTITAGDCLATMHTMPDKCVDLVFTDPPYNKQKNYDGYADDLPYDQYIKWQSKVLKECQRVARRGIVIYICQSLRRAFEALLPDAKLIIIHKHAAGKKHKHSGIMMQWHPMLTTARCVKQPAGHHIKDLWDNIRLPGEGYYFREPRTGNPGQTSIALIQEVLRAFTLPGESVLDPFMGCGSTAIAAIRMQRHYIGIDISRQYCDKAKHLIHAEHAQLMLYKEH